MSSSSWTWTVWVFSPPIDLGLLWRSLHSLPIMMIDAPNRISECISSPSLLRMTIEGSKPNARSSQARAAAGSW